MTHTNAPFVHWPVGSFTVQMFLASLLFVAAGASVRRLTDFSVTTFAIAFDFLPLHNIWRSGRLCLIHSTGPNCVLPRFAAVAVAAIATKRSIAVIAAAVVVVLGTFELWRATAGWCRVGATAIGDPALD